MLANATFMGEEHTSNQFTLYDLGQYPAVCYEGKTSISGEVYQVKPVILQRLDILEGVPDEYNRILIDTRFGKSWLYIMHCSKVRHFPKIDSGIWIKC